MDLDKNIDMGDVTANCRVALRNDSYTLHKILPNKVSIYSGYMTWVCLKTASQRIFNCHQYGLGI